MKRGKRKVYIVLTYTGTILSKIIRGYTGARYCHVSLALDEELEQMYSFGRLNPYNPFIGGFVHEKINSGTFRRFKKTEALICSLELNEKQYQKVKQLIKKIGRKRYLYRFNVVGLFASGFNIRIQRNNSFYCAEFVKYLLDEANLELKLPEIVKPMDFKNIDNLEIEYDGVLRNYRMLND